MKRLLFFIAFVFIIPILCTNNINIKKKKYEYGFGLKQDIKTNIRILDKSNNVKNMDLEEYLIGVVASEVPLSFEDEAIKAQAVASRTYALKQIENNKNKEYDVTTDVLTQVYSNNEQLKEKWGNDFDNNYNRIKQIINDTKNEYISYNDQIIYAFFFSTSNGKTEDNKNVFGEDLPYLKIVDSSFDEEETDNFNYDYTFSKEEFYSNLGIEYSESLNIDNIIKTDSGRIYSLNINNHYFKGRDFQKKLSLRSNDFEIKETESNILISTRGYGHGVGMSQYGANALAKRHKNYKEILEYYYKGVKIKKL